MDSEEDKNVKYVVEVKTMEGKRLFLLGEYLQEMCVCIKPRGDENEYKIPLSLLIGCALFGWRDDMVLCGQLLNCSEDDKER